MNQQQNLKNDDSLFPVFRFDLENRLVYANVPALPLMKFWNCRINEKMPAQVVSRYPELFHAALSHRPTDVVVEFKTHVFRFSIVPFPEARYIGMYAYSMEQNENFVGKNTPVASPARSWPAPLGCLRRQNASHRIRVSIEARARHISVHMRRLERLCPAHHSRGEARAGPRRRT